MVEDRKGTELLRHRSDVEKQNQNGWEECCLFLKEYTIMRVQEFRGGKYYLSFNQECEVRADWEPQIKEDEKDTSQDQSSENRLALISLVVQTGKNLPAMWETQVQSLGQGDPLEKGMATHSSILAWRIPWIEEPGRLQSMSLQTDTKSWHDWTTNILALPDWRRDEVNRRLWNTHTQQIKVFFNN